MLKKLVIGSVFAVALAACGQTPPQQTTPSTATASAAPDPVAQMPAWAREYMGRRLAEAIPHGNQDCTGTSFVDGAHKNETPYRIVGWAWDHVHHRAYDAIVSVGADGVINGGGTTTSDRPDVVRSMPSVTNAHVGYEVITTATSGSQRIYGFDQESHTICSFGVITL